MRRGDTGPLVSHGARRRKMRPDKTRSLSSEGSVCFLFLGGDEDRAGRGPTLRTDGWRP